MRRRRCVRVLIVGPDGSGKSAIASKLEDVLLASGRTVIRQHYRPNALFARGRVDVGRTFGVAYSPQPRHSVARSILKLIATFADIVIDHARRTTGDGSIILVERGWHDQAVDPERYRLNESSVSCVRVLGRLLPRVDLLILATADADAIFRRKPELSLDEISRQAELWRRLGRRLSLHVTSIKTDVDSGMTEASIRVVADVLVDQAYNVRRFVLSPRRIVLQASPGANGLSAAGVYAPHSRRARIAMEISRRLPRIGRLRRSLAASVAVRALECRVDGVAELHSSTLGREVVGLSSNGRLLAVAKVGPEDASDTGLRNEIRSLLRMWSDPELPKVLQLPIVLFEGSLAGRDVLITEPFPGALRPINVEDVALVCQMLQELSNPVVHGDLTPWNMRVVESGVLVWDFEGSRIGRAPVYDFIFFLISAGALLGWYSVDQVASILGGPSRDVGELHRMCIDGDLEWSATCIGTVQELVSGWSGPRRRFSVAVLDRLCTVHLSRPEGVA